MTNQTRLLPRLRPRGLPLTQLKDRAGRSPLHLAAMAGSTASMGALFDLLEVRDDVLDSKKRTPLHLASLYRKDSAVECLLARGGLTWRAGDVQGRKPIHLAALSGGPKIVALLMQHEKEYQAVQDSSPPFSSWVSCSLDENMQTPFHLAAQEAHVDVLHAMVSEIKRINAPEEDFRTAFLQQVIHGQTAFLVAIRENNMSAARCLLEVEVVDLQKQLLETKTSTGETALTIAVRAGFLEEVDYLLRKGADINTKCHQKRNLLHYAVKARDITIACTIAMNSGKPGAMWVMWTEADKYGKVPLDYAAEEDREEWVEYGEKL